MSGYLAAFPPSDSSTHNLSRREPGVKAGAHLRAFPHHCQRSIMKWPSCSDMALAIKPKSLRYTRRSRGNMRQIGGINGTHERSDGQPVLIRAQYHVENFPYNRAMGGSLPFDWNNWNI
jgi:hypothetical protein